MTIKSPELITAKLGGWTPSAAAQSILVWRIMHMFMSRYGSIPMGQMLVGLTTIVLNELGRPPTVTELCEATGLPKSSISRYISAQMEQGVVEEQIDPTDRRRRKLVQTEAGKAERKWQVREIRRILDDVREWDEAHTGQGAEVVADSELGRMKEVSGSKATEEFPGRRRRGRQPNAA